MKCAAWFFVAISLVVMAGPSLLGGAEGAGKADAIKTETPQTLLAVYGHALAQKDWRRCFLCCDPKMRGGLLTQMFVGLAISKDAELVAIAKKWLQIDFAKPGATFPELRRDDRVPDELLWYEALQKRVDDLPGFANEMCRRLDAMGERLFVRFGEVREIKIQDDLAVGYGYWTPPRAEPIGPAAGHSTPPTPIAPAPITHGGKTERYVPPSCPPPGMQPAVIGLPGLDDPPESERREAVHFRRIEGNWYFTYPDPPPPLTPAERAKQLQAEIQSLWVTLGCSQTASIVVESRNGTPTSRVITGKSHCEVTLSVQPFVYTSNNPDLRLVRLSESQAKRLIGHLAAEGFLNQGVELGKQKIPHRDLSRNCYTLQVSTKTLQLHEDLGWGPEMLKRLEGLRTVLEGDGAKAMDAVLADLAGDRKTWEMEAAHPHEPPPHNEPKALR